MRPLLALLLVLLAACAPQAAPAAPTPPPAPTTPLVEEILAGPTPGPVRTIGYLLAGPEGAALVGALRTGGAGAPAPLSEDGIWLGAAPLPEGVAQGAAGFSIVEAAGRLEGPGQYGPGGRYSYSLAEPALEARSARDLTIALLLENSGLYEGQPVRVRGQLLTSPDTALLVESLGAGGVPDANARQVKLAAAPADPSVAAALRQSGEGRVSYGPVEIVGIWRAGRLYPLAVTPG